MIQLKKRKKTLGQGTLEYLLLFGAISAVLVLLLMEGGPFRRTVQDSLTVEMNELSTTADNYFNYIRAN
ncbi:hypothetical protein ACFL49_02800 [Candidatus Omnitrophota bacterium]